MLPDSYGGVCDHKLHYNSQLLKVFSQIRLLDYTFEYLFYFVTIDVYLFDEGVS